jgi:hypothetical protein
VSGYLIFQLFTPLTFSEYGPVEAGKIGITMAVFNALLGVAMGWVSAKNPEIAGYIALGERKKLNTLFVRAISRSIGFVVLAIIGVTMLLVSGTLLDFTFVDRFTSLDVFACIAMVTIGNSFVFAVATYTRAHKEEPMLKVSIITGILIATFAIWGIRHGVFVMMFTYALIVSFIVIPWTLYIFLPYYRKEI